MKQPGRVGSGSSDAAESGRSPLPGAADQATLQRDLLAWYRGHGRKDLPWQTSRTPYRVWVSEIMLQQTQVATVIPYFHRFVARFPDVGQLAAGTLDEIISLWAGLGYYARARNLHRAARVVCAQFGGEIPSDLDALMSLPGVGRSTAGAIRSLGYGLPAAILDGNVKRVFCRHFGIEGWPGVSAVNRELWRLSEKLLPSDVPDQHNQALMDLGATVCTPRDPQCPSCPWQTGCRARIDDRTAALPSPKPARRLPARHQIALLLIDGEERVYLERRPPTGIWGGLWCLPLFEHRPALEEWADHRGIRYTSVEHFPTRRHTFSHFHLDYDPLRIRVQSRPDGIADAASHVWLARGHERPPGLPAPVRKLLGELGYFD
jgi:A/G-specific adenine glycosylase